MQSLNKKINRFITRSIFHFGITFTLVTTLVQMIFDFLKQYCIEWNEIGQYLLINFAVGIFIGWVLLKVTKTNTQEN